jgi:cellulose synthase/poly-beta-1,6-N-acetylglucosamine synthase-like glycosyltransferase
MEHALFIITSILSVAYAVFLVWCISGWISLPEIKSSRNTQQLPFVSVIIPARNESENIHDCLSDFLRQDYPGLFEVIVADDHSTDHTSDIVNKFIKDHPSLNIKHIVMKSGSGLKTYKKQAITDAIGISSGEFIMTTDADCRRGNKWVSAIVNYYVSRKPEMISAPVTFENEKGWQEKIQSLEFLGLIGIGAAAISNNHPLLCNGASLAFSKKVFEEEGGYNSDKNYASGDDTQLMRKIALRGKGRVHFIKSEDAVVSTMPQHSIARLLNQRKRWASKIPVQMSGLTVTVAVIAYLLHAGLLLSAVSVCFSGSVWDLLIPLVIKMIPEFILLFIVSRFFRKSNLLYLFLPSQIIYPVYITIVGIISLSGTYSWKGRQVK